MPIYEFLCSCGHKTESILWLQERGDWMPCESCGLAARLVPSLPSDLNNKSYKGPCFTGTYSEKQQFMRQNGLKEAGDAVGGSKETALSDSYTKGYEEHRKKAQENLTKNLDKVIQKTAKDFNF